MGKDELQVQRVSQILLSLASYTRSRSRAKDEQVALHDLDKAGA